MTSLIDNTIDRLIGRVKKQTAVSDIVFMSAYPARELPNPFGKYTAAVYNRGVKTAQGFIGEAIAAGRKGRLYEVDLILRVYAPRNTAASALLRMTSLLCDALELSDEEGLIADTALGEIAYENTARTVYRDVRVRLCCGEGRDE